MLTRFTVDHVPTDRSLGRVRHLRKGTDVWHAEDPSDRLFILLRGAVRVFSGDPQARDILLETVHVGEPFGELCFCAEVGGVRNSVARVTSAATILEVEYRHFLKHLATNADLLAPLLFTICQRLSDCQTRTQILAQRGAQQRIGGVLLQLVARAKDGRNRPPSQAKLSMSHADVARLAAMSRAHVTVTLSRFRKRHLVEKATGGGLTVHVSALKRYLDRLSD
jgi:CRP-like cAMP-binding protein